MAPGGIDCAVPSLFCAESVNGGGGWDDIDAEGADLAEDLYSVILQGFPIKAEQAVSALLEKEHRHMPRADYLARFQSAGSNAGARQNAISWMLKVRSFYQFGPLSVALAVNYMDRFLSRRELPPGTSWEFQLLAVACMSLAAKMEETEVPFLLDLQVVEVEHMFEARTIQRMELYVLSTLEWRMSAVTPYSYIDYYFHMLGIDKSLLKSLLERAVEIISVMLPNINFLQYRPSVIAAAAALRALEEITPVQTEHKKTLSEIVFGPDDIDRCCQQLKELLVDSPSRRPASKRKDDGSPTPQSPVGVLEAANVMNGANESAHGSPEGSPGAPVPAGSSLKKRRIGKFCSNLCTFESL